MRHPGPAYVCVPARVDATVAEVLAALWEGVCPACRSALEPLPPREGFRAGGCHGCCPCTLWQWTVEGGAVGRVRYHLVIPEGEHC